MAREHASRAIGVFPVVLATVMLLWVTETPARAQSTSGSGKVVYSTAFEANEGYDQQFQLVGQNGWTSKGSGGSGVVTNFFEGFGQQAYIGFTPPAQKDDLFNVWQPVNFAPISSNFPIVKFSVLMQIVDSRNGQYDDFRWSAYNSTGDRLFSLDFDNSSLKISYGLDDNAGFVATGSGFDNAGYYALEITMNFARNLWSASLNDVPVVTSKSITTQNRPLNLGDIDAVWVIRRPGAAGDNYMIFDNYRITAEGVPSMPPRLEQLGFATGRLQLRVHGEQGLNYVVEASTDLRQWEPLKVISAPPGGVFDFQEDGTNQLAHRFYRVWQRP